MFQSLNELYSRPRTTIMPPISALVLETVRAGEFGFARTKQHVFISDFLPESIPHPDGRIKAAFQSASIEIEDWIRMLSAGMLHAAFSERIPVDWAKAAVASAELFSASRVGPLTREELAVRFGRGDKLRNLERGLSWLPGWSSSPVPYPADLYAFDLAIKKDGVVMRHRFLTQFTWLVAFEASGQILTRLEKICRRQPHK